MNAKERLVDAILTVKCEAPYLHERALVSYWTDADDYHVGEMVKCISQLEEKIAAFKFALAEYKQADVEDEEAAA